MGGSLTLLRFEGSEVRMVSETGNDDLWPRYYALGFGNIASLIGSDASCL